MRAAFAALALGLAAPATAAEPTPIVSGETWHLTDAGGVEREINVSLPAGYSDGAESFPVLYLIDGGLAQDFPHVSGTAALNALWGRSKPVLVVGIQSRDRQAELAGVPGTSIEPRATPSAGQSAAFRAFLRDSVKPMVEANYRTTGQDAVIGESLAGLFIVETWLAEPGLFGRYAAINASLWWGANALASSTAAVLADGAPRGPLMLTYSNEGPETEAGAAMVADAAGEQVCLLARPDLTHATAYHVLIPQALQFLFPTGTVFEPEWGFVTGCES